MSHNNCFGHNNCNNPIVFTPDCCNNPQTVPITSEQLGRLITLLNSLIAAIAAFFANPSDANRLALLNLFTQLLNLLNELAPSPEGNFLKQLIQSIINLLQSPNPDLGQLLSLLQQFFSALAPFFFSLIIDPASLQLLLNLLVQLISSTNWCYSRRWPNRSNGSNRINRSNRWRSYYSIRFRYNSICVN